MIGEEIIEKDELAAGDNSCVGCISRRAGQRANGKKSFQKIEISRLECRDGGMIHALFRKVNCFQKMQWQLQASPTKILRMQLYRKSRDLDNYPIVIVFSLKLPVAILPPSLLQSNIQGLWRICTKVK